MPTAEEHLNTANHNLAFMQTVDQDEFGDWMAVVAFYVAVHLVERLRAFAGQHSVDHRDRDEFVRNSHLQIHPPYHELYRISMIVRYGAGPHNWFNPAFATGCLELVREYVQQIPPPAGP